MEKIKVNMTPCEDVKTIHASQNDNATRKWAFDLYDENGKIDSSDIKEQMIFDSRVGGTEQILPENTSDPTTSPIIADIQYPDSLRSEQTFLYRESPTQEDGQAKITHIKGNTLVWNQLVPISATATRTVNNVIYTNNNDGSFTINGLASANADYAFQSGMNYVTNHKYYLKGGFSSSVSLRINAPANWENGLNIDSTNGTIIKCITSYSGNMFYRTLSGSNADVSKVYPMLFDLTSMGIDNLTTTAEVEAWLSSHIGNLPYYAYTQGKLLPFKGEELKTVGFNQWDEEWEHGVLDSSTGTILNTSIGFSSKNFIQVFPETVYYMKHPYNVSMRTRYYDANKNYIGVQDFNGQTGVPQLGGTFKIPTNCYYFKFSTQDQYTEYQNNICVNLSSSENGKYEPYISSTINLPTLTYFPTGMKRAGNIFDELTENKAIVRVGSVDLGTINWTYYTGGAEPVFYGAPDDLARGVSGEIGNIKCPLYNVIASRTRGQFASSASDLDMQITADARTVMIKNLAYTSKEAFASAMSGIYLYYELATPTEEPITTASLVTEKGEAPLYYDDELIADCNETISSESGIFDAKIKLMDDETIYSQKIQLHVERKPQ